MKKPEKKVAKKVIKKAVKKVVKKEVKRPEFKVGDTVVGNARASKKYNITVKGYEGEITRIGTMIELDGKWEDLDSLCFDLVKPKTKKK